MNEMDARFLIASKPLMACELARVSIEGGNGMWRTLVKVGLGEILADAFAARYEIMKSLIRVQNSSDAIEMFDVIMSPLDEKKQKSLFKHVQQDYIIGLDWISYLQEVRNVDNVITKPCDNASDLKALLLKVKAYGIDLNLEFETPGKGAKFKTSVLCELVRDSLKTINHDMSSASPYLQRVRLLMEMGEKLDTRTKRFVLTEDNVEAASSLVRWFDRKGFVQPSEWLTEKSFKDVQPQTLALIQALDARKAIEAIPSINAAALAP